jgi:uncharacterized protein YceK
MKNKKKIILLAGLLLFLIILALSGCSVQTVKSSTSSQSSDLAGKADVRSVFTAATVVVATNPGTTYNGYSTGTTKITDTLLADYLGAKSKWEFTIVDITIDTGGVTSAQIKENGKYYKYNGTAVTSSATLMNQP